MWRKMSESERGVAFWKCLVLCDETYKDLCRLTAERCDEGHITIVCAIFGSMIQSVVCDEGNFPSIYETMKRELVPLLESTASPCEKSAAYSAFFEKYTNTKIRRK